MKDRTSAVILFVKLHETSQMFMMGDYVRKTTVKKTCKDGEYGSFKYLLFLVFLSFFFFS